MVVTAGGTAEPIDPVRYIGNRSTGAMGVAVAEAARDRGARVTLVGGDGPPAPADAVEVIQAETRGRDAGSPATPPRGDRRVPGFDALIMAAAVADFRPAATAARKIARTDAGLALELIPNPDVLAELGRLDRGLDPQGLPGAGRSGRGPFSSASRRNRAAWNGPSAKLAAKRVDLLVANDVAEEGSGFGTPTNRVTILGAGGSEEALPPAAQARGGGAHPRPRRRGAGRPRRGGADWRRRAPAGDTRPVSATAGGPARITVLDFARMYADGERIAMLTAYDYPTAQLVDEAGIPSILSATPWARCSWATTPRSG